MQKNKAMTINVGDMAFVRTSTFHYCGRVEMLTMTTITLVDYAKVGDCGYFSEFMQGVLDDHSMIEPAQDNQIIELSRFGNQLLMWPGDLTLMRVVIR